MLFRELFSQIYETNPCVGVVPRVVRTHQFTTHYAPTLELTQELQSPPSSVVGPCGPARRRKSAGSTTNRRPDLERGPSRASVHTEAWARRAARAPARRHAAAKRCRLAAIKNSFQRSAQWSPAMHREQPAGGLRGGSARRASSVGKHLFRRSGKLEGHGEHQHDGAEGLQPLGPSADRSSLGASAA